MISHGPFMAVLIILSLVFSVLHLPQTAPDLLGYWRPQWILLALILWVQRIPEYRGGLFALLFTKSASDDGTTARRVLVMVWLLGFYLDTLLGDAFGLNGAIHATIAFYLLRFRERLQMQTLLQQMVMVFLMVFLAELLRAYVRNTVTGQPWSLQPLALAVSSMVFWPLYVLAAAKMLGGQRRA
jgi:cell shape-determining protein MreD